MGLKSGGGGSTPLTICFKRILVELKARQTEDLIDMGKSTSSAEGALFLLFQLIFCVAFIANCEVPNWTSGGKNPNACVERWMFAAGLFFPSSIANAPSPLRRPSTRKDQNTTG